MFGKKNYKFTDKKHPISAMIAVGIAILVIILLAVICYQSSLSAGKGGVWIGVIGMLSLFATLAGFVMSINSLRQRDVYYTLGILGSILNGMLFLTYFILFFMGLST